MNKHQNWFSRLTNDDSGRQAAMRANVSISTLNRQLAKGEISAEYVIALARAYDASVLNALVATGYLTVEEISGEALDVAELLTDQQMIRALALRIDANPEVWFGTFGELADEEPENLQEQRRSKKQDESESHVRPTLYAASRRKRQPEEGDEDYGDGA